MGMLFRATGFLLVGTCFLAMNFVLMFLFGFLRNLPALMIVARRVFREVLSWTLAVFRPILSACDPLLRQYLGVDSRNPALRVAETSTLSLVVFLALSLLVGWHVSWLAVTLATGFGLVAGLVWDDLEQSDHLRVGESLQ